MFILSEENRELQAKVQELERQLDSNTLINENKLLRMEIAELKAAHAQVQQHMLFMPVPGTSSGMDRPKTAAEVLDEGDLVDEEITALIRRNQSTLAELRSELQEIATSSSHTDTQQPHRPGRPPTHHEGVRAVEMAAPSSFDATRTTSTYAASPNRRGSGRSIVHPGRPGGGSGTGAGGGGSRPRTPSRYSQPPTAGPTTGGSSGGGGAREPSDFAKSYQAVLQSSTPGALQDLLARPETPNLIGRPIESAADIEAAYEAVAQVGGRMLCKTAGI